MDRPNAKRVAARYIVACLLHNPKELPDIGDRVLNIEMDGGSGMITITFENGETVGLHTGIHWEANDSDTREWQEKRLQELSNKVAARWLQAGPSEWLQWVVQPFDTIWKHHKEFVQGPVDDAMDAIIKDLAPQLVKAIGEQEVDADVDEFFDGASEGRFHAERGRFSDPSRGQTDDYREGYEWGFQNPSKVPRSSDALPAGVKRQVVEEALSDFRKRVTEEVAKRALQKAWHAVSPATTAKSIMTAVRKHGWKLGIGFALFELVEHMILPAVLIALTGHEELAIMGTIPIGEIVYAVAFRVLGRVPSEVNKAAPEGHLDWYEAAYGPVRIASLARIDNRTMGFQGIRGRYVPPGVYA